MRTRRLHKTQIERQIERQIGLSVQVEETDGVLTLTGTVDAEEARAAAEDLAAHLAPGRRLVNQIDVVPAILEEAVERELPVPRIPEAIESEAETNRFLIEGLVPEPLPTGMERAIEDQEVFFPATDPVVTPAARGNIEVIGGFSSTSTTAMEVFRSSLDQRPGDEALADAVRRELREDAATTDLTLDVEVRQRVVLLRGTVPGMEDVASAEEVAGRVPGVADVIEELTVAGP